MDWLISPFPSTIQTGSFERQFFRNDYSYTLPRSIYDRATTGAIASVCTGQTSTIAAEKGPYSSERTAV
jgi:hypothetical protein